MGFMDLFRFPELSSGEAEVVDCFPLTVSDTDFVEADIFSTYSKILMDVIDKTHGITDKVEPLLWDNCVNDSVNEGLITLLAWAMTKKADLFLVYKPATDILREADSDEAKQIKEDYESNGKSSVGVFLSFTNYDRTDLLAIYSLLEYLSIASLHKSSNVSKALQFKIHELRGSVSLQDSSVAKSQAQAIAQAIKNGNDAMMDAKDSIETSTPDVSATKEAIALIDAKKAFILGLPQSYISGIQSQGLSNTGEGDMRAVERGLKQYFTSIIRPAMKAIFNLKVTYQSLDYKNLSVALDAMKTFMLIDEELLSLEAKKKMVNQLLGIKEADNKPDIAKMAEEELARVAAAQQTQPDQTDPAAQDDGEDA